jgi:DNA-binding NarL/FixJ family response regulator
MVLDTGAIKERPRDVVYELSPAEPLTVVIADDHPFYREGLARTLRDSGIEVMADVSTGEAAVRAVEAMGPDVVIMDLKMPGISGLEATRRLTERAPGTRVVVVSVSAEERDVTNAILAGASGYILKDRPVEEVLEGIRAAAAGRSLISPPIATALLRRIRDLAGAGVDPAGVQLSDQELEVLDRLAEGKVTGEIAEVLELDASTVREHISSILTKFQVEDHVQVVVRAVSDGPS